MHTNHHIAKQLAAERQRDLRAAASYRWRITDLLRMFHRSTELETVPPRRTDAVGADGRPRGDRRSGALTRPSLSGR